MREFIVEADGGSRGNPGPAGYGAVVIDAATGETLAESGRVHRRRHEQRRRVPGPGGRPARRPRTGPDGRVHVRMDSKLVVEQMSGRWKIKHPDMKPLAAEARSDSPCRPGHVRVDPARAEQARGPPGQRGDGRGQAGRAVVAVGVHGGPGHAGREVGCAGTAGPRGTPQGARGTARPATARRQPTDSRQHSRPTGAPQHRHRPRRTGRTGSAGLRGAPKGRGEPRDQPQPPDSQPTPGSTTDTERRRRTGRTERGLRDPGPRRGLPPTWAHPPPSYCCGTARPR